MYNLEFKPSHGYFLKHPHSTFFSTEEILLDRACSWLQSKNTPWIPSIPENYLFPSVRLVKISMLSSELIWREGWIRKNGACELRNFTFPVGIRHLAQDCHAKNNIFQSASTAWYCVSSILSWKNNDWHLHSLQSVHQMRIRLLALEMLCWHLELDLTLHFC